nr:coiled-coil domain-containing protein 93-like [Equus asinus]
MASPAARDQFLRQMEQIVEGIKQSRMKMEKKKQENKMRRDQLNDQYLELLEKQRLYFKTVKEFKEVRGGLGPAREAEVPSPITDQARTRNCSGFERLLWR